MDVIDKYCKGISENKAHTCIYLDDDLKTCRLLFNHETEKLWDKCRLPPNEIIERVKKRYIYYENQNERLIIKQEWGIWFELENRLKKVEFEKKHTLINWIAYIKVTVKRQIVKILIESQGVVHVPKGKYCRYCIYSEVKRGPYCKIYNKLISEPQISCTSFSEKHNEREDE